MTAKPKGNDMETELVAIRDAMSKETGGGRDYDAACKLADAYVAAHPEQFTQLQHLGIDECVQAVEVFREAGLVDDQWRVETWILHHYEPLNVGGGFQAQVRIVPSNTN